LSFAAINVFKIDIRFPKLDLTLLPCGNGEIIKLTRFCYIVKDLCNFCEKLLTIKLDSNKLTNSPIKILL